MFKVRLTVVQTVRHYRSYSEVRRLYFFTDDYKSGM